VTRLVQILFNYAVGCVVLNTDWTDCVKEEDECD